MDEQIKGMGMERLRQILKDWFTDPVVVDLLCIIVPVLLFVLVGVCTGCSVTKEIPIQTIEKIEYRDSLIYVRDTIQVPVTVEKVVEVLPELDTSYLETSVAKSTAYLDNESRKLHHTLEQKGTVEYIYDTVLVTQTVDRIVEKEVPVEVEVIKYKRDALFWVLVGWTLFTMLIVILQLCIRFETLVR